MTDRVHDEHCIMQLHPKDTGGSFLEMDWHRDLLPAGAWPPAGDNWRDFVRTERVSAITAAEIQADQPRALAARWSEIVEIDVVADAAGNPTIALTNAIIRFVPIADGRPEGLSALDLTATDAPAVLAAARARRLPVEGDTVTVCGTRFRVSAA